MIRRAFLAAAALAQFMGAAPSRDDVCGDERPCMVEVAPEPTPPPPLKFDVSLKQEGQVAPGVDVTVTVQARVVGVQNIHEAISAARAAVRRLPMETVKAEKAAW